MGNIFLESFWKSKLHNISQTKNISDRIVIRQGSAVLQLFASEDESLLLRWDSFLVLDLGFDVLDGVCGFGLQSDGSAVISLFFLYQNYQELIRIQNQSEL